MVTGLVVVVLDEASADRLEPVLRGGLLKARRLEAPVQAQQRSARWVLSRCGDSLRCGLRAPLQ